MPLPNKIANAPNLQFGLEFYFFAFKHLTTCRSSGYALGSIPWTAMRDYASSYGLRGQNREDFFVILCDLDEEFLSWQDTKP